MATMLQRQWIPSALGAVAAATFVLFHINQPWLARSEPTPILVPCLIALVVLVACIVDVVTVLSAAAPAVVEEEEEDPANRKRLIWYLGSLAAFALLMEPVGFLPVVIVVLPLLLIFGERLPILRSIVVTIATAAVVYIVFDVLLAVDLPRGTLLSGWY